MTMLHVEMILWAVAMSASALSLYAAHRAAKAAGTTFWGLLK